MTTIGVDFKIKTLDVEGKGVKLQIWDTAGADRFNNIISSYYRGTQGVMLVYDITDLDSFLNLNKWLKEIEKNASKNVYKILVGNKCDMENERKVAVEQGKNFASQYGMKFFETSAKSSTKTSDIFITMTRDIINNLNTNKGKIPKGIPCNPLSGKVIDNNAGFLKNLISFVPTKLHLLADNVKEVVKTGISKNKKVKINLIQK